MAAKKTSKANETEEGGVESLVGGSEEKAKAPKAKANEGKKAAAGGVAKAGDIVKVDYSGKFSDGKEFDNSAWHGAPLQFTLGAGQVVPGFDKAVVGMKRGESKTFTIKAAEAYGEPKPELVREIPRETLPTEEGSEEKFKPGMMIVLGAPNGMKLPAVVREISPTKLVVDFNHPLAGKDLTFEIKLVE